MKKARWSCGAANSAWLRWRIRAGDTHMRVGFDIGGTFTDVIVLGDDGRIDTAKVLSLLDRVGEDIVGHIRQAGSSEPIANFVHGTTIASNAVIEGTTAPTGYITTRGFRDDLEMRGERRPNLQDPNWVRGRPLCRASCVWS